MNTFGRPNAQQLRAVIRCQAADMAPMMSMFESTLEQTMQSLVGATDPATIHRLQGKAQILTDFLGLVKDAPRILERLE